MIASVLVGRCPLCRTVLCFNNSQNSWVQYSDFQARSNRHVVQERREIAHFAKVHWSKSLGLDYYAEIVTYDPHEAIQ